MKTSCCDDAWTEQLKEEEKKMMMIVVWWSLVLCEEEGSGRSGAAMSQDLCSDWRIQSELSFMLAVKFLGPEKNHEGKKSQSK